MKNDIREYFENFKVLFDKVIATDINGKLYKFDEAIDTLIHIIVDRVSSGRKLLFIGNGGSAAISSHIATDFCKNAGIRALAFNDSSLITCVSNDYGYKYVFEKPIGMFAEPKDILIAISSSGQSENILRGVAVAKKKKAKVCTFSGFDKGNPLRRLGDLNFYVPMMHYGYVEVVHLALCHCLVDMIIKNKLASSKG